MSVPIDNPVVVASVGNQLSATLRASVAQHKWQPVYSGEPISALKAIRLARAKVAVVEIHSSTRAGLELIRLLSGPPSESSVIAVSGVHDESIERDARAMGAACYVPFTTDVSPVVQAVSTMLDRDPPQPPRQARSRPIRSYNQISSFSPPSAPTGDGREPGPSPVRRNEKNERETMHSD